MRWLFDTEKSLVFTTLSIFVQLLMDSDNDNSHAFNSLLCLFSIFETITADDVRF